MRSRKQLLALFTPLLLVVLFGADSVTRGQDVGAAPSARAFPQVGPDLKAIKRDSSGRYYILAKPPSVIWVFAPDGQLAGKIPDANFTGAIRYAVDIDLDSAGDLLVADRGANAVEVFQPDGALRTKVPVFAPASVVALPGGKFAVVSLRSKYLVDIFDESGSLYDSFGDRSEVDPGAAADALFDPGKIYGDSAGHIYFAFTSMTDPMIRKYDRSGYMDYAAPLPIPEIEAASKPEDRLQFGLDFGQMNISDQLGAWATIGTSGTLQFGTSMGTGFGQRMGRGFGGWGGGGTPSGFGNPSGAANGTGALPGALGMNGATFFGQGTIQNGQFHFNLGAGLGRSHFGRGAASATDGSSDGALGQASLLQFNSSGFSAGAAGADTGAFSSGADAEILEADPSTILNSPDSTLSADDTDLAVDQSLSAGYPGLQPGMFAGGMFFRPHGGGFGGAGGAGGGGLGGHGFGGARRFASGAAGYGAGAAPPGGSPNFRPGGHFVFNTYDLAASVRVNLDRPAQIHEEDPKLTAIGVDPATGESWIAIGSQLVNLSADGSLLGSYYMATPDGTPLHANAILVEHNRLLIADDPLGIFAFSRPDRSAVHTGELSAKAVAGQSSR